MRVLLCALFALLLTPAEAATDGSAGATSSGNMGIRLTVPTSARLLHPPPSAQATAFAADLCVVALAHSTVAVHEPHIELHPLPEARPALAGTPGDCSGRKTRIAGAAQASDAKILTLIIVPQ